MCVCVHVYNLIDSPILVGVEGSMISSMNHFQPLQAVLVSVPDIECGFSRDLFVQWASNPRNSIILTSRPASGCLARKLIDNLKMKSIELEVCHNQSM